jgi:hypothetical protein
VTLREAGSFAALGVAWRPAAAAGVMALTVWLVAPWSLPLAIVAGVLVYGVVLLVFLRAVTAEERAELRALLHR